MKNLLLNREQSVIRARSMIGKPCHYKLGAGGRDPNAPAPWDAEGGCDCSGFAAWCLGVDRYIEEVPWYVMQNGGWLETSAIVRDALSDFGIFTGVPWNDAQPADLVVYGDAGGHQGHVGLITGKESTGILLVTHCSMGNFRTSNFKSAINETTALLWHDRKGLVARYAGFALAA
jgi:cell wall-associated NlpC family hydrolase